ncbi:MAG: carbohydrate kinase, partial [Variovorax sp.]|nr:carbohydrate kinase [Variovorax sp.]
VKVSDDDLALLYPGEEPGQVAVRWLGVGVSLVTVTRGAHGASSWTRNAKVDVPSLPVKVVDTVGAGDTFQAALLSWLDEQDKLSASAMASLDTQALEAMLKFASKASSITCSRRGADMPRRSELD